MYIFQFIKDNLTYLAEQGVALIRLDAFAYATKKAGTSCFFIEPDVWELLSLSEEILEPYGVEVLPEIHEHYTMQKKIEEKDYYVYDFALPMLLIHALYYGESKYLKNWLNMCPRKQYTTLDTHDDRENGFIEVCNKRGIKHTEFKTHIARYNAGDYPCISGKRRKDGA